MNQHVIKAIFDPHLNIIHLLNCLIKSGDKKSKRIESIFSLVCAQVMLGNIRTDVGWLRYAKKGGAATATILGVVFGLLVPLIIIAVIVVICLRRRNQLKKRNKVVLPPPNAKPVPNNYQENSAGEGKEHMDSSEPMGRCQCCYGNSARL